MKEGGSPHRVDVPDVGHTTPSLDDLYGQSGRVKETHRFGVVEVVPDPDGWGGGFLFGAPTPRILLDMVTKHFVNNYKVVPYKVGAVLVPVSTTYNIAVRSVGLAEGRPGNVGMDLQVRSRRRHIGQPTPRRQR